MENTSISLLQLLEHIESCSERIKFAHNVMSRNGAIIMFLEEAAFVEECMSSLYDQWQKHLPLYADMGIDYNCWIKKLATLVPSNMKFKQCGFSYYTCEDETTSSKEPKNEIDSSILSALKTLQTTQISHSECSNVLKPIIEKLKQIKRLLDNPSQEQYKELGDKLLTYHLANNGAEKNYDLKRNTPPSGFISEMDSEIKRLHEYYKAKGLNGLWLTYLSKSILEFDPAIVGQIVFSMRTRWDEKDTRQFIEDYSYIILMNNHRIKLNGYFKIYGLSQEHPGYTLAFDEKKLREFLPENIRKDLFISKLREVCNCINEFQCKDYEFVYIIFIILTKEKILKGNTGKNGFFKAFSPNMFNGNLDTWRTYGRKISHTYNEFSQKKLPTIAQDSKYSEAEVLYDSFGKLKQKLPRLIDVEEI